MSAKYHLSGPPSHHSVTLAKLFSSQLLKILLWINLGASTKLNSCSQNSPPPPPVVAKQFEGNCLIYKLKFLGIHVQKKKFSRYFEGSFQNYILISSTADSHKDKTFKIPTKDNYKWRLILIYKCYVLNRTKDNLIFTSYCSCPKTLPMLDKVQIKLPLLSSNYNSIPTWHNICPARHFQVLYQYPLTNTTKYNKHNTYK